MASRKQLTPEQLALSEQRKLKKQKQAAAAAIPVDQERGRILNREWITLQRHDTTKKSIRFMTWNLLAQCLVRRELFPTSDCLKANQREHMLHREILSHQADIMCLQEVDRLESLLPVLDRAGYSYTYAAGPSKKHGCLVGYKKDLYEKIGEKVIRYDEQEVHTESDERARRGSSFKTKNIASLVALKRVGSQDKGFIMATTHLFWHPRYTYERTRQAAIMLRETIKFRDDLRRHESHDWPCMLCGDFNFSPHDPAYALLVGESLTSLHEGNLEKSRVVHHSIDPTIPVEPQQAKADDDEEGAEKDPDKVIVNARSASLADGLLTNAELINLFTKYPPLRSAYDVGQKRYLASGKNVATFGTRLDMPLEAPGACEPEWTSYTHYWQQVLDYIFILDPAKQTSTVTGYSKTPQTAELVPGLPKSGVSGSDHISLCVELQWENEF